MDRRSGRRQEIARPRQDRDNDLLTGPPSRCDGTMHPTRRPALPLSGGFGFPLGALVGVLVTTAVDVNGGTHHLVWSVIAYAAAIVVLSALTTPAATLGTAVLCWFLLAGFVVGRQGDVRITAGTGEDLVVLILTALVAVAVVQVTRRLRRGV